MNKCTCDDKKKWTIRRRYDDMRDKKNTEINTFFSSFPIYVFSIYFFAVLFFKFCLRSLPCARKTWICLLFYLTTTASMCATHNFFLSPRIQRTFSEWNSQLFCCVSDFEHHRFHLLRLFFGSNHDLFWQLLVLFRIRFFLCHNLSAWFVRCKYWSIVCSACVARSIRILWEDLFNRKFPWWNSFNVSDSRFYYSFSIEKSIIKVEWMNRKLQTHFCQWMKNTCDFKTLGTWDLTIKSPSW